MGEPGKLVSDSGFWDAYNTVYTLQSLVFPTTLGNIMSGWVNAYREAGWLPQWPSPGQRHSMVGTMGDVSLADAILKSSWGFLTGFDVHIAYEAIRKDAYARPNASFGRVGLEQYLKLGYLAEGEFSSRQQDEHGYDESVSRSLYYWVADAAIARAADALGYTDDHKNLFARSRQYTLLFNNASYFFQPKARNGSFYEIFDPLAWRYGFTESCGWHNRFFVPHDVEGLKKLYQGNLCASIAEMLTTSKGDAFHIGGYGRTIHEQEEAQVLFNHGFGFYAHNNQPVHHVLWVAKKAGCNTIGDRYLRKTMDEMYKLTGWPGDEDTGEMSSWYVLSALGLFQLEGAADELVLGSPAIERAKLTLPDGKALTVTTANQSRDSIYVQSVMWTPTGGTTRLIEGSTLKFTEVMRVGGRLHFVLGSSPPRQPRRSFDQLYI